MFDGDRVSQQPLADKLRPEEDNNFFGQEHLLASGLPLNQMLRGYLPLHSMILWGPPGCGKTTLARLLVKKIDARWFQLSAVTAGVREIRMVVSEAEAMLKQGDKRGRVLFIDECHRFNKSQQDGLLPHVESGLFIFVGATTENPSFEMNNALLSRVVVYPLYPLSDAALSQILSRAAIEAHKEMNDDAFLAMIRFADGDARRLLNFAERIFVATESTVEMIDVNRAIGDKQRRFDKGGDYFYDQISALHKSIRGSNPDAALYWLCRMLDGGTDPRYIGRRLIRIASEDIGLADPRALTLAIDGDESYRRLGSPEGELALAEVAVYLASVPKSDAVYTAYNQVRAFVQRDSSRAVPAHLQNAPTALMKTHGHGKGYRHAHNEEGAYAAGVKYFPDDMTPLHAYRPTNRGLEKHIAERLNKLRLQD